MALEVNYKNCLSNRTQKVIVEGKMSDSVTVISGVPQGTVLGPDQSLTAKYYNLIQMPYVMVLKLGHRIQYRQM